MVMRHDSRLRIRRTFWRRRPSLSVECTACPWTYDAGDDFLDAIGHAKVHAERAERTVR